MSKPVILTFIAYYLPGYKSGGPLRTISNMVQQLGEDFSFRIITRDRDKFEQHSFSNIRVDAWNDVGKARVFYASKNMLRLKKICRLILETQHDVVYLNSFFDFNFSIKIILARKCKLIGGNAIIIAPRGEFSAGALRLKNLKKKLYIRLARLLGLYNNVVWHASSELEREDIVREMRILRDRVLIATNLGSECNNVDSMPKNHGRNEPVKLVFVSRISPKKNLDYALRILHKLEQPVIFSIYGPIDDEAYWKHCLRIIEELPVDKLVQYCGSIEHCAVCEVLQQHDLFILPTRGENYGHAIIESLAAGTPVLISDQTPWNDLEDYGVGWSKPLCEEDAYVEVIEQFISQDEKCRILQRNNAKKYADAVLSDVSVRNENMKLFEQVLL